MVRLPLKSGEFKEAVPERSEIKRRSYDKRTDHAESTVVRRGVRRDKKRKEQDQVRPLWSGQESGETRKKRNRIRRGLWGPERSQEGQGRNGTG